MEVVIAAAMVLIIVAIGWGLYIDSQRTTIEIKKDEWACVKSEQQIYWQPISIGNATILQPMVMPVCVEYRRHAG
jgi:Tfp pilus assembly protein PilO